MQTTVDDISGPPIVSQLGCLRLWIIETYLTVASLSTEHVAAMVEGKEEEEEEDESGKSRASVEEHTYWVGVISVVRYFL